MIDDSRAILLAVKMGEDHAVLRKQLSSYDIQVLKETLNNDNKKKTFWINVYNAYYQILRKQGHDKPDIYKKKLFNIAGQDFSLDDVEHGILRRYRYKYSLGLFANIFTPRLIKELAVDKLDYRIHFALNCGAKSCPPIAFYKLTNLDQQLDLACQSFLEGETRYDEEQKQVYVTALFQWFAADFGGKPGIKRIYKEQLDRDLSGYAIKYDDYSWEEDLDNYSF